MGRNGLSEPIHALPVGEGIAGLQGRLVGLRAQGVRRAPPMPRGARPPNRRRRERRSAARPGSHRAFCPRNSRRSRPCRPPPRRRRAGCRGAGRGNRPLPRRGGRRSPYRPSRASPTPGHAPAPLGRSRRRPRRRFRAGRARSRTPHRQDQAERQGRPCCAETGCASKSGRQRAWRRNMGATPGNGHR